MPHIGLHHTTHDNKYSPHAMTKKGPNEEVILVGMGMQKTNKDSRYNSSLRKSRTKESTDSKKNSSANTPNKSDILNNAGSKQDAPVHITTVRNKQVESGSKSFQTIQESYQGSQHIQLTRDTHKRCKHSDILIKKRQQTRCIQLGDRTRT